MLQGDEDILRLNVEMHQLLAVDILQTLRRVDNDSLQLGLREPSSTRSELFDLARETASLAVLILNVHLK